ncbi:hypothetical protein ABVK25_005737 [Lepraria finkii]|uniref:Uncharacterized protein n=1 Tax=Lepraria finkii TaxID=1340010 RepID=A0ABR4B8P1_9LECA
MYNSSVIPPLEPKSGEHHKRIQLLPASISLSSRELIPAQTSLVLDFSLNPPRLGPPTPGLLPRAPRTRFYPIQQLGALTLRIPIYQSILQAAAPALTAPQVDAGQLLKNNIGESTKCAYNTNCAPVVCGDVRDDGFRNNLLAKRVLAYTAYINFSNFFYSIWNAPFNAATL